MPIPYENETVINMTELDDWDAIYGLIISIIRDYPTHEYPVRITMTPKCFLILYTEAIITERVTSNESRNDSEFDVIFGDLRIPVTVHIEEAEKSEELFDDFPIQMYMYYKEFDYGIRLIVTDNGVMEQCVRARANLDNLFTLSGYVEDDDINDNNDTDSELPVEVELPEIYGVSLDISNINILFEFLVKTKKLVLEDGYTAFPSVLVSQNASALLSEYNVWSTEIPPQIMGDNPFIDISLGRFKKNEYTHFINFHPFISDQDEQDDSNCIIIYWNRGMGLNVILCINLTDRTCTDDEIIDASTLFDKVFECLEKLSCDN